MAEETKAVLYDDGNFHLLMTQYKSLSTYEGVNEWDGHAQAEIEKIAAAIRRLEEEIVRKSEVLEQAQREHAEKSIFKRTFGSRNAETDLAQLLEKYKKYKSLLEGLAERLQEAIDFTPNSNDEQKALLKELRLRKKELQAQKRELTTNMKAIREDARVQSVHAGKGFLGIYDSKLATSQRRQIRYAREAALGSNEDAKQAIERQVLQVERDILWVERFDR